MNVGELGRLAELLRAVRRRLRAVWAWDTVQALAPLAAAVALVLVLAGWVLPWTWTEWVALALAVAVALGVLVTAVVIRVPDLAVARVADRGLATRDVFATALEIPADVEHFGSRVRDRAVHLAADARPADAVPVRWRRRALLAVAVLAPLAVALALITNPQDTRRATAARERAAVVAVADDVAAAAERLRTEPAAAEAVARLDELAAELRATDDLARAEELAAKAADELARTQTAPSLATKAAVQGLQQSLDTEPLPGAAAGQDAAAQLGALAAAVANLGERARQDLAERLDDLAATQQAGDPAASAALAAAADALREGDMATAQRALTDAAAANSAAGAAAAGTAALGEAAAAARQAADAAAGRAGTPSEADTGGEGQGQGQGQGNGQGEGQGQGDGQGGGGSGGAGGSPSGDVSGGGSGGNTDPSGQGGQGQGTGSAGGTKGEEPSLDSDSVYDPTYGEGDQLTVGGGQGPGEGAAAGPTDGPTNAGSSWVPLAESIGEYREQATAAMDRSVVAPSDRQLVRSYFDLLQGRD